MPKDQEDQREYTNLQVLIYKFNIKILLIILLYIDIRSKNPKFYGSLKHVLVPTHERGVNECKRPQTIIRLCKTD